MPEIKTITVIGAGTMGAGIAQVAAQAGYQTILNDLSESALENANTLIRTMLAKAVKKEKMTQTEADAATSLINLESNFEKAVSHSDLVIEAAPEKMELKKSIFRQLVETCPPHTIFASNTSSLSLTEIANASGASERVLGMHFFNPPAILKLLEIVTQPHLSSDVLQAVQVVADRMQRQAITVKDSPGFASSRLGIAIAMEAIRMLESGVATAADIDTAMEAGYRHPMGPLKLTDHVGLDVRLNIAEYLFEELKSESFRPPALLKELVAAGKLGKKSGQGFYNWESKQ